MFIAQATVQLRNKEETYIFVLNNVHDFSKTIQIKKKTRKESI
jgi:hypothetical protein